MGIVPNASIKNVHKMPWAYVILLLGGLIGFFAPIALKSKDETAESKEQSIQRLTKTIEFYRVKDAYKDSLQREELKRVIQEKNLWQGKYDSLSKFVFDNNTKGLERVISIIQDGKSAVVIKPKKK